MKYIDNQKYDFWSDTSSVRNFLAMQLVYFKHKSIQILPIVEIMICIHWIFHFYFELIRDEAGPIFPRTDAIYWRTDSLYLFTSHL